MSDQDNVLLAGKARWLLEGGLEELNEHERALLLALVSLEAGTGRTLTGEEQAALDRILAWAGTDGQEIARAVQQMVEAKPKKRPRLDWSDLKDRRPTSQG